jgi:hypothetical protein
MLFSNSFLYIYMLKLAWNNEVMIQQQVAVQQFLAVQFGSFKLEKKNSLVVYCSAAFGCSLGNQLGIAKKRFNGRLFFISFWLFSNQF